MTAPPRSVEDTIFEAVKSRHELIETAYQRRACPTCWARSASSAVLCRAAIDQACLDVLSARTRSVGSWRSLSDERSVAGPALQALGSASAPGGCAEDRGERGVHLARARRRGRRRCEVLGRAWRDDNDGQADHRRRLRRPRGPWDEETHDLYVRFTSGNTYRFEGVAKRFFGELRDKKDQRRFVRDHLMSRFEYERVSV